MAYEYKKLSEVEVIDVADSSVNLIVETEDKIKKLNIGDLPIGGQEQADWNEEDETKASFIKNKPDLSNVGGSGGGEVIVINVDYSGNANWTYADGTVMTPESLKEKFEAGANVYISHLASGYGDGSGSAYHVARVFQYVYVPSFEVSGSATKTNIELYYYRYIRAWDSSSPVWKKIVCVGQ